MLAFPKLPRTECSPLIPTHPGDALSGGHPGSSREGKLPGANPGWESPRPKGLTGFHRLQAPPNTPGQGTYTNESEF